MVRSDRRRFTTDQKVAALKRHLAEKVPVSTVCEDLRIQPSLFYHWQRQLLDNAAAVFERSPEAPRQSRRFEERIAHLETKLARKDSVIAELSEEYVQLKKDLGES